MEIIIDIKSRGIESARTVCAPLDKELSALTEKGYGIISLPQNSKLRIQEGYSSDISQTGNWISEGVLYFQKGKPNKIVRNSPTLESVIKATKVNRRWREFYPMLDEIEKALVDSIDFPEDQYTSIPTNRFGDGDFKIGNYKAGNLTIWAFGGEKEAKAYGEFLRRSGIKEMQVHAVNKDDVNKKNKPFVRQLYFRGLGTDSTLSGDWSLGPQDNELRGIKISDEGIVLKIEDEEAYSPKEISKALTKLGFSGLDKILLEKLRQ